jgi:hypothetical protein
MESSSSYETFSTKLPDGKRKRTRERESIRVSVLAKARLSTKGPNRRSSDQEEPMIEEVISPETPLNSAIQCGPLDDVGSISSCKSSRHRFVIEWH